MRQISREITTNKATSTKYDNIYSQQDDNEEDAKKLIVYLLLLLP